MQASPQRKTTRRPGIAAIEQRLRSQNPTWTKVRVQTAAKAEWHSLNATPAATPAVLWLPLPGQYWPEQGGIYVGIAAAEGDQPAGHIVLLKDKPATRLNWADALQWAKAIGNGAHVPTRFEAALLYANVRSQLDTNNWHWTSTEHQNASSAWNCYFYFGGQDYLLKSYDGSAVAVRRLDLYSLNPLIGGAA